MNASPSHETLVAQQKILLAAQDVLARKKVSGTRMREIAHSAGISLGTLNYYYPSKTSLFLAVLDEMQRFFETRQEQLMSTNLNAAEKIRLFSDQQRELLVEYPQMEEIDLDFLGHAMVDADIRLKIQSMYAAWRRDIRLAIDQGVTSGDFDPKCADMTPYLFVALLEGIALQYLLDKTQIDLETAFNSVNQVMMHWLKGETSGSVSKDQQNAGSTRKPYPSDLSETQWLQIRPLLDQAKEGGRPRSTDLREIVNALLYMVSCNCSWRMLPHDFPSWQTVYAYYRQWNADGVLHKICAVLGIDWIRIGKDAWTS
jgi:transposase/AcrR family transcriptional regulator